MKKKRYTAVVVGCGQIGALFEAQVLRVKPASHASAIARSSRTMLAALVDTNKKQLAAAHKLFPRAHTYTATAECLRLERPDIVVIATPSRVRLPLIRQCAKAGVSMIVCEKPLAASMEDAREIERIVNKHRIAFVLNYQRRFSPLFARARALVAQGKLGSIQQITAYYSNGLYNNAGHTIDALRYLLGEEIRSVSASLNTKNKMHPKGDLNSDALLTTKSGTVITLQSFNQAAYGIHDISIFGTKGSLLLTDYGATLVETPARPSSFAGVRQLDHSKSRVRRADLSPTADALARVIECRERRASSLCGPGEGVAVLRVLDAIRKSAEHKGKRISV